MADRDYKAFIVEGEAREPLIIDNISKVFFQHGNFKIITLPAGENIYMLWKKLKEDDFDIDILEEKEAERERVFVLSAFPEFLVDYFGIRLWKTCVKHTKNRRGRRSYGVGDKTF